MIDINVTQPVNGSGLNGDGMLSGLDLISSIQILLIQDYDNQLKHIGSRMKIANEVKKAYRQDIETMQKFMTRDTRKIGDHKDWVWVSNSEKEFLNTDTTHIGNQFAENPKDRVRSQSQYEPIEFKDDNYVRKTTIDSKINMVQTKLDTVNEGSQLTSLQLQSLTNQRKIAFETLSNLVRKEGDTLNSIIRNMIG